MSSLRALALAPVSMPTVAPFPRRSVFHATTRLAAAASAVVAGLAATSSPALAQSSVTLFGVIDANVRYVKNGDDHRYLLGTDGNSSSRLGVRGTEDLGGGLKAGFWLESQVNVDSGTANAQRFWHRRSTVSLSSASLGEIRLGRDQTPTWRAFAEGDVFGTVGVGDAASTYTPLAGIDTKIRSDNLVAYFLPSGLGGVYGSIAAAPGEGVDGKRYVGGQLGWKRGGWNISGAYAQTRVVDDDVKLAVVSGGYDFGIVNVVASVQEAKYLDDKDRHYTLGAIVPVPSGQIKASFSRADGRTGAIEDRDANQFALGYVHDLSKRTALYATYAQIHNQGTGAYTVYGLSGLTMAAGETSRGVDIGIRHAF